jgi:hypothetical protein
MENEAKTITRVETGGNDIMNERMEPSEVISAKNKNERDFRSAIIDKLTEEVYERVHAA